MDDLENRPSYEPTESPLTSPAPVAKIGSAQRLVKSFYAPGEVFEDILVKPTWVMALVAMIILTVAAQVIVLPHVDREATLRSRLGDRADEITESQIESMLEQSAKITRLIPVITAVVVPIMWAALAGIFFLMLKMVGSETD